LQRELNKNDTDSAAIYTLAALVVFVVVGKLIPRLYHKASTCIIIIMYMATYIIRKKNIIIENVK
jgi:hypothetical protein